MHVLRRPITLRRRLTIASAVAVAIAIALAASAAYFVVRDELRSQVDSDLRDIAARTSVAPPFPARPPTSNGDVIHRRILPAPLSPGVGSHRPPLPSPLAPGRRAGLVLSLPAPPPGESTGYTQLVTAAGAALRPRGAPPLPFDERTLAVAAGDSGAFFDDLTAAGVHLRVFTTQVRPGQALQVARSLTDVDSTLDRVAWLLVVLGVGGIGLAALIGLAVTRTALRPVSRLSATAEEIAETRDLSRRIEGEGEDEIGRLIRSFNVMLAALDDSIGAQRQLVADASHELRTPLTSLRTNIETLSRANGIDPEQRARLLDDVVDQLDELGGLVGDVVELARDGKETHSVRPVRLDLLVADVIGRFRAVGQFDAELHPTEIQGAPERLERAVRNLIDNAVKWSPPDAPIEVALADDVLSVRDHGPGIPDEELPLVFDRFHRAAAARGLPGSGLGLAIVRQVAESGGGWAEATNAEGGGALLRVSFGKAVTPATVS